MKALRIIRREPGPMSDRLAADLLVGARAAAEFSGLSERQVYHLAANGQLPCIRKGKRLYFRRSEIEAAFRTAPDPPHPV